MRTRLAPRGFLPVLTAVVLSLLSACALQVEMTSTPDQVQPGAPVTFNVKLTNRSACPLAQVGAEILAFIPADHFVQKLLGPEIPPNSPPEVIQFLEELEGFFDDLCTGGTPDFPTFPMIPMIPGPASCARSGSDMVCSLSGPLTGHEGNIGGTTFAGLGDHLQCQTDGTTMSCTLRIPLPTANAQAAGSGAANPIEQLDCVDVSQVNFLVTPTSSGAFCVIGTFPSNVGGLLAGQMATGQVSLPARGSGFVRNLVFGFSLDSDPGVCKGGSNAGQPCSTSDSDDPCPGSTCGEGICVGGGANAGKGCDEFTAGADCPGGTCSLCDADLPAGALPLDCTTTYVAPQGVPAMSPWGLAGLAILLVGFGTLWLQRRARRA